MIHPSAIVHPSARVAEGVSIGAYSVIGEHVEIGAGTWIGSHAVIEGWTRIGVRNRIFHYTAIGGAPQDKKYAGEETTVEIGDDNTIREYVTVNRGTAQDTGATRIGNDNLIMAYVHVAHDCQIGSHTIFANLAQLAGHVYVGDWAILGGMTGVHQFVRIGAHSFTGIGTHLLQDLPPYVKASGDQAKPYGINGEGLRRRGFGAEAINGIKRAYRTLYRSGLGLEDAKRELQAQVADCPQVQLMVDFLAGCERGITR